MRGLMAERQLLISALIRPAALQRSGFRWAQPAIADALAAELAG